MTLTAFISYKSEYREFAFKVRDTLRDWRYGTWIDQDDITIGKYFRTEIQKGLESSQVVIGVVTQKALESREVLTEWDFALTNGLRLLLLMLDTVKLPYWLSGIQHIDFTTNVPLGFEHLHRALQTPDTSRVLEQSPEYLSRHTENPSPTTFDKAFAEKQANELHRKNPEQANRSRLLLNIYESWIEGVLDKNLEAGSFELSLALKADAVLRHTDYGDYSLPDSNRNIRQIFHDIGGQLLILGKPGSGKTMLMLELGKMLLAEAQYDLRKPIPVILNLSSWGAKKPPLERWLVDSLRTAYGVPMKIGRAWLNNDKFTLMLDGLDEVAVDLRSECVAAINAFQSIYLGVDLVVCSRIADYESLQERLSLNGAILLQDLTEEQIQTFLVGDLYQGVRDLLENELEARTLAETPFLLNTMKITYGGTPYGGSPFIQLKLPSDRGTRRDHLLERYVEQQLTRTAKSNYSKNLLLHWLSWLAWQMDRHESTLFYIEDLKQSFLPNRIQHIGYRLVSGMLGGFLVGLFAGTFLGLIDSLSSGAVIAVVGCLLGGATGGAVGMVSGFLSQGINDIRFAEAVTFAPKPAVLVFGLLIGIITWLSATLIAWLTEPLPFNILVWLLGWSIVAVVGALATGQLVSWKSSSSYVSPQFRIVITWLDEAKRGFASGASGTDQKDLLSFSVKRRAVITGTVAGSMIWFVSRDMSSSIILSLLYGVLIFSLVFGLETTQVVSKRSFPGNGFGVSFLNSLKIGLISGVLSGALGGIGTALGWSGVLFFGGSLMLGLLGGFLIGGGQPVLQHLAIRYIFTRAGYIPLWRYDHFLDTCADVGFLRKVGGGYIFRHRMLMEYFAEQYEKTQKNVS